MRNLKKILAMALTVLMVVGSFAMTASAESYKFDDVTDYQEAIEVMAALKVASGYGDGTFGTDDNVTREQMALWIAKIMTGKTEEAYVNNNFMGAVENLTAFADIDEENYVGAINYAANNGIIVGTSATTFEAGEAIKIQDVFAMVVRMLGYGSTAMNQQYPWSFIDKAISLGLDEGLAADYSVEAAASRGETMQILYNALTALKSDGSTLGYDFFGLEKATVVITGTADGNAYSGAELIKKTVDDEEYVSFAVLGANGNVSDTTYYALKSAFGIDGEAAPYVGKSFTVRTNDAFASFLTYEANSYEVVDQDAITGAPKHAINETHFANAADRYVDIEGASYKLVKAYSNFNGATKTNNDYEIILVNADGARETVLDFNSYVMNKDLHILDENGEILLYWVTTHGIGNGLPEYANLNGMYLYKIGEDENGDPVYVQPNDYIWSLAAKASITKDGSYGFAVIEDSYCDIEEWDAYSDTVLYDDDNDGDYDRGVYYQYKFGYIDYYTYTYNGVGYPYLRANGAKVDPRGGTINAPHYLDDTTYYNADGEVISYNDIAKKYVLYWYSPLYETMIVKEIFEGQTGLVTGVDLVNKTLTLNAFGANIITGVVAGETYTIGNEKLKGADYATLVTRNSLKKANNLTETIGKNINYIEKDGKILAIYNAVNDAKHMVYVKDNIGYTTMGYKNILAYYDAAASKIAPTMSVVTVNAMNNYWYSAFNSHVTNLEKDLVPGMLLAATEDSLGNYDISVVELVAKNAQGAEYNYSGALGGTNIIYDADGGKLVVLNGVLSSVIDDEDTEDVNEALNGFAADGETAVVFAPFKVTAATVWIVGNGDGMGYETFVGIPTSGATIEVDEGATVYYESSENFVYVTEGEFSGTASGSVWGNSNQNSTIIYVTDDTVATMNATNAYQYGYGVNVGMTYSYTNAIDVINGGVAQSFMTDYNFNAQLLAGHYYLVKNGYVVALADDVMADGILAGADNDGTTTDTPWGYQLYTEVLDADGKKTGKYQLLDDNKVSNSAFPIVYAIQSGNTLYYSNWDEKTVINILDQFDNSTNTKYKATAIEYAAGYDYLNNAEDVLDGAKVKFVDPAKAAALGLTVNANAPVFIQTSGKTPVLIDVYDADVAANDALEAAWEEALEDIESHLGIYAWDKSGATGTPVDTYFGSTASVKIYSDAALTEEISLSDTKVNGKYYNHNAADIDAEDGITIYFKVTGTATLSFNYMKTDVNLQRTLGTVSSVKTDYVNDTTPYSVYAVKLDNTMLCNLDKTELPTEAYLAAAVVKLVVICG